MDLTCQVFSQREPLPGGHGRELRARQRLQVAATALGLLVDHADAEPPETEVRFSNLATLSSARYSVASFLPDGLADAAEEGEEDEDGEGADERRDDPVSLLEAIVLGIGVAQMDLTLKIGIISHTKLGSQALRRLFNHRKKSLLALLLGVRNEVPSQCETCYAKRE